MCVRRVVDEPELALSLVNHTDVLLSNEVFLLQKALKEGHT